MIVYTYFYGTRDNSIYDWALPCFARSAEQSTALFVAEHGPGHTTHHARAVRLERVS